MSPATAKTTVLVTFALMLAFIALEKTGQPKYKRAWAAGIIALALSFLADIAPEVAGPLALLTLMAVAVKYRGELSGILTPVPKVPAQ